MKSKQLIFFMDDFLSSTNSKFFLSFLLLVTFLFAGLSQGYSQIKVSGSIIDGNGQPLIGATVIEKGTSNGSQADFDGNYLIKNLAPVTYTLRVS